MRATYVEGSAFGGPSVLRTATEELGAPGDGQILLRQHAVGVNFIDVLLRRGELSAVTPYRPGLEAAGSVLAVGPGVTGLSPGGRVVYAGGPAGSYADVRLVPAGRAVTLPDDVDDAAAAAVFFKALTADYLVHRLRPISPGDAILFTAAAGGVGSLAVPMAKAAGAVVIGTVGKPEKVADAERLGCDHVLVLPRDFSVAETRVRDWTDGRGVSIAFDSIGKTTFDLSIASLARFGLIVSYGWASGEVPDLAVGRLREQGSVFLTRPTVAHYTEKRADLEDGAARVFEALRRGVIRPTIYKRLSLDAAGEAHSLLESGANSGAIVLEPN